MIYPGLLCAALLLICNSAFGAGFVRVDTSGFLRHATDRDDTVSSIVLGPELYGESRIFAGALDLKGVAFVSDRSSFTLEAGNAYIATSPQLMPHHQVTLGRRIYDWSMMEDQWRLGLWSARFLWNPLSPERIGLTGMFYSYQSAKWRLLAFGTPLSPPERSYPIRDVGGSLSSPSPDYPHPYTSMRLRDQEVPINYSIQYPPLSELLVRPAAGLSLRYGSEDGPWASTSYGVMPMHQARVAVQAGLNPQAGRVDAVIHPQTLFHHLISAESGYRGNLWSVWASVTGEAPIQKSVPPSWITDPMGPALLAAVGGEIRIDRLFALSASYLDVEEDKPPMQTDTIPLNLPSRFEYSSAFQIEGKWTGIPRVLSAVRWVYDLDGSSSLLSLDLTYEPSIRKSGPLRALFGGEGTWTVGVGADLISSMGGSGFIGQYVGNDRVRGRVSYAF